MYHIDTYERYDTYLFKKGFKAKQFYILLFLYTFPPILAQIC